MKNYINKYDFEPLRQQIIGKDKWRNDVFQVYPYEAGSGKSRESQKFLGEMTKQHDYRVLYVQRFIKDNQLQNTVNRINEFAEKEVTFGITGEDIKRKGLFKKAVEAQILVCSHSMYKQFCKGQHPELISKREILIIDERMDLIERISISIRDISNLWGDFAIYEQGSLVAELAEKLKGVYYNYLVSKRSKRKTEIFHVEFGEEEYSKYIKALNELSLLVVNKDTKTLLMNFQSLLKNGGLFFNNKFYTFEDINFFMLEDNLILDANGSFDATYKLNKELFLVQDQPPIYDYSQTVFHHYEVNTGKKEINGYKSFFENSLKKVNFNKGNKILFITDKDSVGKVQEAIMMKYANIGDSLDEIEELLDIDIKIDYFGNIIGSNNYREFDTVVILKTPNYSFIDYALVFFYYEKLGGRPIEDIRMFEHEKVEMLRKSTVAGEIYQGIKRINRDLSKDANIYLFCSSMESVKIVLNQLKNVQYEKYEMSIEEKKNSLRIIKHSEFEKKVALVKEALIDYSTSDTGSIRKKEVRKQVGITDRFLFSKILKVIKPFLVVNHIESYGQKLIFK